MLVLHYLNNSRSQRILWLLEELNVPYELKVYQRDPKTNLAPSQLKLVHPLGKSPVLTDGDATIAESGNIIDYLLQRYSNNASDDVNTHPSDKEKQEHSFWLHYSEGSFMPPLVAKMVLDKGRAKASPFFVKFIVNKFVDAVMDAYFGPNIAANLEYVERHLIDRQWFVGDALGAADFQMSFPLEAVVARQGRDRFPAITAFVDRVHQRPAYKAALKKAPKYDYA
ncbi:glutathione S-transferase [Alteromonas oceanisediminis]|uniref:glutathione S-transferase n=1 Tax=Alteromonas oceanisediminis TaxID=2836180 RepID=UPI001BDB20AF|nr:glutathione S-transferase [Alteromonas oceanisediminis]MBT0586836.1 glutathione S-transferase [Alteromonas oceanisediminis]